MDFIINKSIDELLDKKLLLPNNYFIGFRYNNLSLYEKFIEKIREYKEKIDINKNIITIKKYQFNILNMLIAKKIIDTYNDDIYNLKQDLIRKNNIININYDIDSKIIILQKKKINNKIKKMYFIIFSIFSIFTIFSIL